MEVDADRQRRYALAPVPSWFWVNQRITFGEPSIARASSRGRSEGTLLSESAVASTNRARTAGSTWRTNDGSQESRTQTRSPSLTAA